jgi:hypothetical protein
MLRATLVEILQKAYSAFAPASLKNSFSRKIEKSFGKTAFLVISI